MNANSDRVRSAAEILSYLTIEQKISLISGASTWKTTALPEHGIPSVKLTDGPNGARGESIHNSTKAVCFPCGACLGATWDRDLVREVGVELAQETVTKGAQVILGPTMNIHRSPLAGRNFESFSEDPVLTGHLAAAYVEGVQSEGIAATPKHFIANEVEKNRTSVDTLVGSRTLREIYLAAFQIMFRHSNPLCLMTSYNKLNGLWCSEDKNLLQLLLRGEWSFKGIIMSDWFGTYSNVDAIAAGLNLEMPGPPKRRGKHALEALDSGLLSEEQIDYCALPVLELALAVGKDGSETAEERCEITPQRIETARRAAREGIVVLKNQQHILPLNSEVLKTVAVIGAAAKKPMPHGGGSASVRSSEVISPLTALEAALPKTDVRYSKGVPIFRKLPSPMLNQLNLSRDSMSRKGVELTWFDGREFLDEKILLKETLEEFEIILIDPRIQDLKPDHCVRLVTFLQPDETGEHLFALTSSGPSVLYVDGGEVGKFDGMNTINEDFIWQPAKYEKHFRVHLKAGQLYEIKLQSQGTFAAPPPGLSICPQGCRVGYHEQSTVSGAIEDAADLAQQSEVALIFVGNTTEWESEGFDRESLNLGPGQDELVAAVAAKQPRVIVINQSGAPIAMPWVNDVQGVVQVFFAGQEAGNAIADLLVGSFNPCGRLPTTFPVKIEDTPSFGNFPGTDIEKGNRISYEEGLLVGYRHYEAHDVKPLFPFGFGLSYTSFDITDVTSSTSLNSGAQVSVNIRISITNSGNLAGSEIVQIYVDVPHNIRGEIKSIKVLKGFVKFRDLRPQEHATQNVILDKYAFSTWSEREEMWEVLPKSYNIHVGTSLHSIGTSLQIELVDGFKWRGF